MNLSRMNWILTLILKTVGKLGCANGDGVKQAVFRSSIPLF